MDSLSCVNAKNGFFGAHNGENLMKTPILGAMAMFLTAPTAAMINNISVAPSTSWFFALSPFESILLGLVILQVTQKIFEYHS